LTLLDDNLQSLYRLADGVNRTASYKSRITAVRRTLPKLTTRLEMRAASTSGAVKLDSTEAKIAETLEGLIRTAGFRTGRPSATW